MPTVRGLVRDAEQRITLGDSAAPFSLLAVTDHARKTFWQQRTSPSVTRRSSGRACQGRARVACRAWPRGLPARKEGGFPAGHFLSGDILDVLANRAIHRVFGDHDYRVTDPDLGVDQLAIWPGEPVPDLLGAKRPVIEGDRGRGI